ncbi:MAG: DPP IV N-terminal domain-containing protein [Prevotella sp.]|nr:DPP IV N-terminal domain-containing protein [Prevotella sp.]
MRIKAFGYALFALIMTPLMATLAQQKQFTLEDLNFGGNNYYNMSPKNMYLTWWGDVLMYQDAEETGTVDMKTGEKKTLFTLDDVNGAWSGDKMRSMMNVRFPYPEKPLALLRNGKQRLLYDWQKKVVVWSRNCENEAFADWNSKSKAVAFVRDNQLCITDAEGKTTQISTDGSRDIVYGQAVHRNEFGIMSGTFWNNDGTRLAFYRMDQSMVTDYPQVNTFERVAQYAPDKYPMAGMTSHKVTVGVYDMNTGKTVYLDAGDPTDRYFTNIAWAPDSKTIYMQELNRDQNEMQLVAYDAITGVRKDVLYEEKSDKYVEPQHPIVFLPWDNSRFILQSQRDGYNHLYIVDTKKKVYPDTHETDFGVEYKCYFKTTQLTSGSFVVQEIVGFNAKKKSVIILSNEKSPIQSNVFAVNTSTGKRQMLDNGRGVHYGVLSTSGSLMYDKYSEPDVPRNIEIINTATAKRDRIFSAPDPWIGYNVPEYSCGTIKAADGTTDLYYRMVKPIDFDPAKKYPTVVYVYGGPHAHNVDARWHYMSRSWETYMAQKGYLIFVLDNRGSENRGLAFEQATFRNLGQEEMKDQMKGVEYLKSLPYVDTERLGVHGWSYGGFMTISLMTNYPDVFKVGVAGGPVIDWKWYEVMYGERYMDTPESNPEGYKRTSLIDKAKDLKGKLQIIIGMNDPTVVPQHALQFINACTETGTQPDFFVYPGEGHNMMGHKSVHLHERITQYFEDYLK